MVNKMRNGYSNFTIKLILSLLIMAELMIPILMSPLLIRNNTSNEYFPNISGNPNKKWYDPEIISYFSDYYYDPSIAVDNKGNVHIVWQLDYGFADDIFYRVWDSSLKDW
ncbi:unnamed protein product, partial [marine sediment metagenome]